MGLKKVEGEVNANSEHMFGSLPVGISLTWGVSMLRIPFSVKLASQFNRMSQAVNSVLSIGAYHELFIRPIKVLWKYIKMQPFFSSTTA